MNLKQIEVPKEELLKFLNIKSDILYFKTDKDKYIFFIRDDEGETIPYWDLDIAD